jgi:Ca2+-binding RTX toxin-like protein
MTELARFHSILGDSTMGTYNNIYPFSILLGSNNSDTMNGHQGSETIYGLGGRDYISAGAGNDTVYAGAHEDSVFGQAGNDIIYGEEGNDNLWGDNSSYSNGDGHDEIFGDQGNDVLVGGSGNDTVRGGDDNDFIIGDYGLTELYGKIDNPWASQTWDGNDNLYGDAGHDKIYGMAGDDALYGGSGNDLLHGGVGGDLMMGGSGDDIYHVDNYYDVVLEDVTSAGGNDTVYVRSLSSYTLSNYAENLVLEEVTSGFNTVNGKGNSSNNILAGNSLGNLLEGLGGNDTLHGVGGNDRLEGGNGHDTLYGGFGKDTLLGGADNDYLVGVDYTTYGRGEIDQLTGGTGADTFVLGEGGSVKRLFYSDGSTVTNGRQDFALIKDFEVGIDRIQLFGTAAEYSLQNIEAMAEFNQPAGVGVFLNGGNYAAAELIGVFEGLSVGYNGQFTSSTLDATNFTFVQ